MSERQNCRANETLGTHDNSPIPAARPLSDFAWERIDDDLVLFDAETMQYHTLNGAAQGIWASCDGASTVEQISGELGLEVEVVAATVGELGEASLLVASQTSFDALVNRRVALKVAATGGFGVFGIPLIKSITAPDAASAASLCSNIAAGGACPSIGAYSTCSTTAHEVQCCNSGGGGLIWWPVGTAPSYLGLLLKNGLRRPA